MSSSQLVNIIEDSGKGVRAYVECSRVARKNIAETPELATAFFLLSVACDRFVDAYDDQPLLSQRAEDEFLHFKSYVDRFEAAEKENSEAARITALNEVARQVSGHKYYRSQV